MSASWCCARISPSRHPRGRGSICCSGCRGQNRCGGSCRRSLPSASIASSSSTARPSRRATSRPAARSEPGRGQRAVLARPRAGARHGGAAIVGAATIPPVRRRRARRAFSRTRPAFARSSRRASERAFPIIDPQVRKSKRTLLADRPRRRLGCPSNWICSPRAALNTSASALARSAPKSPSPRCSARWWLPRARGAGGRTRRSAPSSAPSAAARETGASARAAATARTAFRRGRARRRAAAIR